MSTLTLKEHLINTISLTQHCENPNKNNLKLITPAGLISGTFVNTFTYASGHVIDGFVDEYYCKYIPAAETELGEKNDSILRFEDVLLNNGTTEIHLRYLVVFIDQIIGITYE